MVGIFQVSNLFLVSPNPATFFSSLETPFQPFFRRPCLVVFGPIRCKNTILALWVNFFWGEVVDLYKGRQGTRKKMWSIISKFPYCVALLFRSKQFQRALRGWNVARLQLQLRGSKVATSTEGQLGCAGRRCSSEPSRPLSQRPGDPPPPLSWCARSSSSTTISSSSSISSSTISSSLKSSSLPIQTVSLLLSS